MAVGWEALELADKLALSYDRVAREAKKANVQANVQAPGFVGPPSPFSKDSVVREILDKAALQAAKEAAKAAEAFVAALKKEYDMLGLTTEQSKLYEIQNAKLPPSLLKQALALYELGEAKRKVVEEEKKAASLREQTISNMERELEYLLQQTEEYKKSALAIADANAAKAGQALLESEGGTVSPQVLASLEKEYEFRKQIVEATLDMALAIAQLQVIEDQNQALSDSAQGLAQAFGNVGQAISGMTTSLAAFGETQQRVAQDALLAQRALAEARKKQDPTAIAKAEGLAIAATNKQMQSQVRFYGDIASSAKGLFKEKSTGYKIMEAAEKSFRAVEFALAVKAMVMDTTETGQSVLNAGIRAVADGIAGIAKAFAQMGIFGFIGAAAIIAFLGSIGVRLGGGGSKPQSAEQTQTEAGTGSVFGDSTAKSSSIENSIKKLEENSFAELEYTNAMLEALRSIQKNIEGLTNTIVRQLGIPGGLGDPTGLNLGTTKDTPLGRLGLWGPSTERVLKDFGIMFTAQTLAMIESNGVLAQAYKTVETTTIRFFGLYKKKKSQTILEPLDEEIADQFTMIILDMRDAVVTAGEVLGIFGNDLSDFVVDLGNISFIGLTGKEIQEQLTAVFGKLGDDMAKALFPAVTEFAKVGEGAFETLTRLARDYQTVDLVLKSIGQTFALVGLASIEARERLIDLSGGIDEFIEQAAAFAQTYLTEAEQAAPILNSVLTELDRLGITGVYTMDAFKQLVLGLDLTTEEGAALYAALLKLAPAFATAVNAVHDAVQRYFDLILEAQQFQFDIQQKIAALGTGGGGTAIILQMGQTLLEQYKAITTTLEDKVSILNRLSGLVGQWVQQRMAEIAAQKAAVQEAANLRLDALNKELNLARQWTSVLSSAKQLLDQMRFTTTNPLPTSGRLNLASLEVARLQQQLAGAAPEDRADISKKLLDALQKQLTLAQEFYQRPSPEYQAIYNNIISQITAVESEAQNNADKALLLQIEISALQEATVAELKAIDAQIESVNAQATAWYQQIAAEGALVYEQLRKQAEADLLALADAADQREKVIEILSAINAKLGVPPPGFAHGLENVPYDNFTARLHKGERVLTAQESQNYGNGTFNLSMPVTINGGSGDAKAIAAEVKKTVIEMMPVIKQKLKRA